MSKDIKRIAVYTSGGDAPGMNAAIRAVVRTATFHDLHVYGIRRGYQGMIDGDIFRLETRNVGNIIHRGGTFLKTSRSQEFRTPEGRQKAIENLNAHDIDACVAIGGNGTFTGAHIFGEEHDIPVIGIPGTIDNDLWGTDITIGFDTACNTAIEAVDRIRDTADSHNRLFFIEVMGRKAGYIGLYTGLGSGAGSILIPETDTDIETIVEMYRKGMRRKKLFNLVIIAEGNENGGAQEIADKVMQKLPESECRVAVIGHLQRGGAPSCLDRLVASRLGYKAVTGLMEGKRDVMVGISQNRTVYVPLKDAIERKKSPDEDMILMANILAQ